MIQNADILIEGMEVVNSGVLVLQRNEICVMKPFIFEEDDFSLAFVFQISAKDGEDEIEINHDKKGPTRVIITRPVNGELSVSSESLSFAEDQGHDYRITVASNVVGSKAEYSAILYYTIVKVAKDV